MKKKLTRILMLVLAFIGIFSVVKSSDEIIAKLVNYSMFINGEQYIPSNSPIVINDRTYLPVREIAEYLGMDVQWSEEEQKITITEPVEIAEDGSNLLPFKDGELYGYMDTNGMIRIKPQYQYAYKFSEGYATVEKFDNKIKTNVRGVIDINGDVVIPFARAKIGEFHEGLAIYCELPHFAAEEIEELGYSNVDGEIFVDSLEPLQHGYIDCEGNKAFEQTFIDAYQFSCGLALVNKAKSYDEPERWTYIDKTGNYATELEFEKANTFNSSGYATVQINGKSEVIDTNFKIVNSVDK